MGAAQAAIGSLFDEGGSEGPKRLATGIAGRAVEARYLSGASWAEVGVGTIGQEGLTGKALPRKEGIGDQPA